MRSQAKLLANSLNIGACLLCASTIVLIVCLGTTEWARQLKDDGHYDIDVRLGLFRMCQEFLGRSHCKYYDAEEVKDNHQLSRILSATGTGHLVMASLLVGVFVYQFYRHRSTVTPRWPLVACAGFSVVGGVLNIVGVAMYAQHNLEQEASLSWAFYAYGFSTNIAFFAGFMVNCRRPSTAQESTRSANRRPRNTTTLAMTTTTTTISNGRLQQHHFHHGDTSLFPPPYNELPPPYSSVVANSVTTNSVLTNSVLPNSTTLNQHSPFVILVSEANPSHNSFPANNAPTQGPIDEQHPSPTCPMTSPMTHQPHPASSHGTTDAPSSDVAIVTERASLPRYPGTTDQTHTSGTEPEIAIDLNPATNIHRSSQA